MFSFEGWLDLPLIWFGLIITAIFLYVILDGFDLGVGILFPFAPSDKYRDRMMNSIAPFWDGNETWLVLGGGGLFAAFPLAYAVLMPAFYIPVILMLLGLVLRGWPSSFALRPLGPRKKFGTGPFTSVHWRRPSVRVWSSGGLFRASRCRAAVLAAAASDWLSAFSIMIGLALVCGYALLGATWLVMKTADDTQQWARRSATVCLACVAAFMILVSLSTPFINAGIKNLWFSWPNIMLLSPLPLLAAGMLVLLWLDLRHGREYRPFFLGLGIFLMNYIGLGISIWPWLVPYEITFRQAAASPQSQSLLLIGAAISLPLVLAYAAYNYYVFRGKTSHEELY